MSTQPVTPHKPNQTVLQHKQCHLGRLVWMFFKNVQKFGETKLNIKKTAKALGKVQYLEKLEFML